MSTHLDRILSDTNLTINVFSSDLPVNGGIIQIDDEKIRYEFSSDLQLIRCTRGYESTTAAIHTLNSEVVLIASIIPNAEDKNLVELASVPSVNVDEVNHYDIIVISTVALDTISFSIPNPTDLTKYRTLSVCHKTGSLGTLTVNGQPTAVGSVKEFVWDGTTWLVEVGEGAPPVPSVGWELSGTTTQLTSSTTDALIPEGKSITFAGSGGAENHLSCVNTSIIVDSNGDQGEIGGVDGIQIISRTNPSYDPSINLKYGRDPEIYVVAESLEVYPTSAPGTTIFRVDASGVKVADGTEALPSYSFISDPNTGIFRYAEDVLMLVANGTAELTIDAATGIGLTPSAELVSIQAQLDMSSYDLTFGPNVTINSYSGTPVSLNVDISSANVLKVLSTGIDLLDKKIRLHTDGLGAYEQIYYSAAHHAILFDAAVANPCLNIAGQNAVYIYGNTGSDGTGPWDGMSIEQNADMYFFSDNSENYAAAQFGGIVNKGLVAGDYYNYRFDRADSEVQFRFGYRANGTALTHSLLKSINPIEFVIGTDDILEVLSTGLILKDEKTLQMSNISSEVVTLQVSPSGEQLMISDSVGNGVIQGGSGSSLTLYPCEGAGTPYLQLDYNSGTFVQNINIGTDNFTIDTGSGGVYTMLKLDTTAVAGNTSLLLYDVDNATLARVSVGADDSGGTGYKVLRIPN